MKPQSLTSEFSRLMIPIAIKCANGQFARCRCTTTPRWYAAITLFWLASCLPSNALADVSVVFAGEIAAGNLDNNPIDGQEFSLTASIIDEADRDVFEDSGTFLVNTASIVFEDGTNFQFDADTLGLNLVYGPWQGGLTLSAAFVLDELESSEGFFDFFGVWVEPLEVPLEGFNPEVLSPLTFSDFNVASVFGGSDSEPFLVMNEAGSSLEIASLVASAALDISIPSPLCTPLSDLTGDLDADGTVGFEDFLTLSANFGSDISAFDGNSYTLGDLDCSGDVDFADFLSLSGNYGQSLEGVAVSSVPEPGSGAYSGLAFVCLVLSLRRRGRCIIRQIPQVPRSARLIRLPTTMTKYHLGSIAIVLLCLSSASLGSGYEFQTLDFSSSDDAEAVGISNDETIVGNLFDDDFDSTPFVWKEGIADFPTINLDLAAVTGVNDTGVLFGSGIEFPFFEFRGFVIADDGVADTFSYPNAFLTVPQGINNFGVIVGIFESEDDDSSGSFIFDDFDLSEFTLPEFSTVAAFDINDAGSIVGGIYDGEEPEGFIWKNGVAQVVTHPDGPTELLAINNADLIVGTVFPDEGPTRSFVYDGSSFTDVVYSEADETTVLGLNDAGTLVGSYLKDNRSFAFVARPTEDPQLSCEPVTDLLGDVDADGTVAFSDFLILSANFGVDTSEFDGNSYTLGDIDCSGDVAFGDFLNLSANFGTSLAEASSVPEPSGQWCLGLGLLCTLCGIRRNR